MTSGVSAALRSDAGHDKGRRSRTRAAALATRAEAGRRAQKRADRCSARCALPILPAACIRRPAGSDRGAATHARPVACQAGPGLGHGCITCTSWICASEARTQTPSSHVYGPAGLWPDAPSERRRAGAAERRIPPKRPPFPAPLPRLPRDAWHGMQSQQRTLAPSRARGRD